MAIEAYSNAPVEALMLQGQSLWMDNIARSLLTSGELRRLAWQDRVVGVTSNPTIFEKAMAHGPEYEEPARRLAEQGRAPRRSTGRWPSRTSRALPTFCARRMTS